MWAFSLIPDNWRAKGNDLIWFSAFLAAMVGLVTLIWKMKWLRRFILWFWRRAWGRDEHGVYLTPTVRKDRRTQAAVRPLLDEQSSDIKGEFGALRTENASHLESFRAENAAQHSIVANRIDSLSTEVATMGVEVAAMKLGLADLTTRMAAAETALMNGELTRE